MAPKMDPGGLLKRVRKTVGDSSAQKGLLDASGAVKKKRKPYLKVVGGDSCFPKGGRVRGGKGRKGVGSRDRSPRLPGEALAANHTKSHAPQHADAQQSGWSPVPLCGSRQG